METHASLEHLSPSDTPQSRVEEHLFYSKALGREKRMTVILPRDYASEDRRFPVLYLLHGWNGDYKNWTTFTELVAYSERYAIIIVTPDAENSWYVNSAVNRRFADYIISDLISEIDGRYRTIPAPNCRAIAGLSMGGYGAMRFALKHPDLFAVAGSISGAFAGPCGAEEAMPEIGESIRLAFGPEDNAFRRENRLELLLEKAVPSVLPYLFLTCGAQDPLLPFHRTFVTQLCERQALYESHEYPGSHTWEFWDHSLPLLLEVIAKRISA